MKKKRVQKKEKPKEQLKPDSIELQKLLINLHGKRYKQLKALVESRRPELNPNQIIVLVSQMLR